PPLHPANALPSTATALPQTFTGAVTGATTWLPPRIEPAPEVRLPPAPLPARPTTLAPPLHPALAPPATATAVPHTFTGAVTGATTWLPPRIDPRPEVRLPPAPEPARPLPPLLTAAPPLHPALAPPATATAVPHTFTGAVTGATTWLPPRIDPRPEVRLPPAPEPARPLPPLLTAAPPLQAASEPPKTEIALPQTFTGAVIGATTWLPPRIDPRPEVRLPPASAAGSPLTIAPPWDLALAPPRMPTALPLMSTGRVTGRLTWLPPPIEWSPSVSANAGPPPVRAMTPSASNAAGFAPFAQVRIESSLMLLVGDFEQPRRHGRDRRREHRTAGPRGRRGHRDGGDSAGSLARSAMV